MQSNLDKLYMEFQNRYEIHDFNHALVILKNSYQNEFKEILEILNNFELLASDIISAGGNKTGISNRIDSQFYLKGWTETSFKIKTSLERIDTKCEIKTKVKKVFKLDLSEVTTHKIDCFKNKVAFEIEWNNKAEFFIRDLNNFRLLNSKNLLSVGIIILTRSNELNDIFVELNPRYKEQNTEDNKKLKDKYGASTTHVNKLINNVKDGAAGGCPILVIGIGKKTYRNDL